MESWWRGGAGQTDKYEVAWNKLKIGHKGHAELCARFIRESESALRRDRVSELSEEAQQAMDNIGLFGRCAGNIISFIQICKEDKEHAERNLRKMDKIEKEID